MSKDLLVLADEYAAATATFARALALKDEADSMSPIAREAGDKRAVLAEALAALDTAQPEPVNAMLVEALDAALVYVAHMGHGTPQHMCPKGVTLFDADGVEVKLPDGRVVHAGRTPEYLRNKALTAAQQAQPERAPSVDKRLLRLQEAVIEMYCDWKKGDFALPRLAQLDLEACFEAANCGEHFAAIKQGGQHD